MKPDDRNEIIDIEITDDNRVVINHGEKEVRLHPSMPKWLVRAYVRLSFETKNGLRKFVLSLTDNCNIKCDYCCHPRLQSKFDIGDALRLVDEACECSTFGEVCLTGGEPFLHFDALLEIGCLCRRHDMLCGAITNGYWAKDPVSARTMCEEILGAGVGRITFSWDPSHGQYVSAGTVMNGLTAAMEAGLKVNLTGSFASEKDSHEDFGFDLEPLRRYANFAHSTNRILPAGRGQSHPQAHRRRESNDSTSALLCPGYHRGHDLVLYPLDGLALPCCSVFSGYKLTPLRLGDWREDSVRDLADTQMADGFYRYINREGFKPLRDHLREKGIEIPGLSEMLTEAVSPCEVCTLVAQSSEFDGVREICDVWLEQRVLQSLKDIRPALTRCFESA
ncbi:radical SAM protein [bacterium]|nr:radical SAM protein [bacterium]